MCVKPWEVGTEALSSLGSRGIEALSASKQQAVQAAQAVTHSMLGNLTGHTFLQKSPDLLLVFGVYTYLCLMVPHFHVNLDHTCFTYKNDVCFVCFFFSSYWNLLIFNRWGQQTADTQSFLSKVKHLQQPVGPRRDRSEVESLKSRIRAAQEEALRIFSEGERGG